MQVVSQWDSPRTDWLLGTTLRAPYPAHAYTIDEVSVQRITLLPEVRHALRLWVYGYYFMQGPALDHISEALAAELKPFAQKADLIHNVRIGREGLSFASLKVARQRSIPFILTPVHHPRWGGWLHRFYHKLYRDADAVVALTEVEKKTLVGLGVDERRVFVTGHGPVLARQHDGAAFRQRYSLGQEPLILFLGQKYPYKGLDLLLKAAPLVWPRFPDARFVFIGPRTDYSRKLFAEVTDRRILEIDAVSLEDKTSALEACDLLCLPSTQESFGGVFTEAWSFEKPVIGCNIPAVANVVEDGQDGLLVAPQPKYIADAILTLLAEPSLCLQLGKAGFEKTVRYFSWPHLAALTEKVYERTLAGL